MSDLCERCGICCKLIPVDTEAKTLLRDGVQPLTDEFLEYLIPLSLEDAQSINEAYVDNVLNTFPTADFFKCKFLAPSNLCSKLNIPEICQKYPSHPFALIPDNCGYLGEVFVKNEEVKQKIRRYKEEIIDYQVQIECGSKDSKSCLKIIESLQRFIKKYEIFGAEEW